MRESRRNPGGPSEKGEKRRRDGPSSGFEIGAEPSLSGAEFIEMPAEGRDTEK